MISLLVSFAAAQKQTSVWLQRSPFPLKCLMYRTFPCSELPRARAAPASCLCPWCQCVYRAAGTVCLSRCPQKCLGTAPATAEAKEHSQWAANICSLFWRSKGLQLDGWSSTAWPLDRRCSVGCFVFLHRHNCKLVAKPAVLSHGFCVSQTGCWEIECPRKGWQDCHWL